MAWWMWLILAAVLGIIELSSITFVILWIAIAAGLTSVLALLFPHLWPLQVGVFAALSVVLLLATRPLARRWKAQPTYETHLETRVRQTGTVVSGADAGAYVTVRIDGELWSAICEDSLTAGERVQVVRADGPVLRVARIASGAGAQESVGQVEGADRS